MLAGLLGDIELEEKGSLPLRRKHSLVGVAYLFSYVYHELGKSEQELHPTLLTLDSHELIKR